MSVRAFALTIDVDGLSEYAGLHGIAASTTDPLLMYEAPLARFVRLCDSLGATATIFAIGRDVVAGADVQLRPLLARGFEIATHSYAHDYAMSLRTVPVVVDDIARARDAIATRLGKAPVGFRAPGYLCSTAMLDALEALEFTYDSSVLPSPSYYAAKLAVISAYKLMGKDPASKIGSPQITTAPTRPYRPGANPYKKGTRNIIELPISVATLVGLPLTTAAIALAPKPLRALMARAVRYRDIIVVNAHAIDFADAVNDGIPPEIVSKQPELKIPVETRIERIRETLVTLLEDRPAMTCAAIARCLN
jgi:hypothetical protein